MPLESVITSAYQGILENLSAPNRSQNDISDDVEMEDSQPKAGSSGQSSTFQPAFDWSEIDLGSLDDRSDREKQASVAQLSRGILQYLNGELAWPDDEEEEQPGDRDPNPHDESTSDRDNGEHDSLRGMFERT